MFAYACTLVGNCAFTMTHSRLVRSGLGVPGGYDPGTTHPLRPPACPAVCLCVHFCLLAPPVHPPGYSLVCSVAWLSAHRPVHLYARSSVCLYISLSACMSGRLFAPPVCPHCCLIARLSAHLPAHLFVRPLACSPTCLFTCLSRCLFVRPLVCILVCSPLVCSAACLSTHLFIFIYISMYIYLYMAVPLLLI